MNHVLPDIWTNLEALRPAGENLIARTAIPELTDRVKCAVDSSGKRHLLVTLKTDEDEVHDSHSRGLTVTTKELAIEEHHSAIYIDIECLDNAGYPALDVIGNELANEIGRSNRQPREIVNRILTKWRRFWGQIPHHLLSHEEQIGLFAELWFLCVWLLPRAGPASLSFWRGPFGSRHDFEWPDKSVEVKATTQTRGRIFHVNGLDQLETPQNGTLYLFSVRLREEVGATHHIPELIESCRDQISSDGDTLTKFENLLLQMGYSPFYEEEYAKMRFRILEEALFEVRDDFPRLGNKCFTNSVPAGIESIEYVINLNGYDHLIAARKPDEWLL